MDVTEAPRELSALAAMAWTWAADFLPKLLGTAILLVVGFVLARWAGRAVATLSIRNFRLEETFRPVVSAVIRYGIQIIVLVAALSQLGVQTASILAVLGAAGLAIGLALQGTLSNIAAGLMLLWLRPFRAGEYIETATAAGTVREIGLFVTTLDTFDGVYRFVPNSEIWNRQLVNYSRNRERMLNLTFGIPLDADAGEAERLIREVLARDGRVLGDPPPEVFTDTMTDGFAFVAVRAWLPGHGFWTAQRDLTSAMRASLDGAGIKVQRLLHPAADIGDPEGPAAHRRAARR